MQMVEGACKTLNVDFAIAATGVAGPGGGTKDNPVGTIWLACGKPGDTVTQKLTEDDGRDLNIAHATNKAMQMFFDYLIERVQTEEEEA